MIQNAGKTALIGLKESGDMHRQGITFHTSMNSYLYDTGTGKVVLLDEITAPIIDALMNKDVTSSEFADLLDNEELADKIAMFLTEEHLLCNPPITHFVDYSPFMSEENMQCEQLIIELTGKCNMRCRYCTYNDHYDETRSFNDVSIDFDTAKKAIDYAYSHRNEDLFAVTFYGGEPLLNFDVMKKCIDYCLETYSGTNTSFSFTTNLTLMTSEIAEYLVQVPNMSIVVSIDGPERIQNQNRVFAQGTPSFSSAFKGLKILCDAIGKFGQIELAISTVLMPPYTAAKFDEINDFFESLDMLPEGTIVSATYPSPGSIPNSVLEKLLRDGYDPLRDVSWLDWASEKAKVRNDLPKAPNLFTKLIRQMLVGVHQRRLVEAPIDKYGFNACCIPTNRRLYVCADGTYMLCEKIGEAPPLGNVDIGIDFDAVKEYYLTQYESASIGDCSQCWAVNLCDICYAECYSKSGINIERKRQLCKDTRETALLKLRLYHSFMETSPDVVKQISILERT